MSDVTTHRSHDVHSIDGKFTRGEAIWLAETVIDGRLVTAWGQTEQLAKAHLAQLVDDGDTPPPRYPDDGDASQGP